MEKMKQFYKENPQAAKERAEKEKQDIEDLITKVNEGGILIDIVGGTSEKAIRDWAINEVRRNQKLERGELDSRDISKRSSEKEKSNPFSKEQGKEPQGMPTKESGIKPTKTLAKEVKEEPIKQESSFNKDVKGEFKTINKDDYEGINEFSHDRERDIGGINENMNNDNRDFAGINDIPDDRLKDFEGINENSLDLKENIEDGENLSDEDKGRNTKEFEPTPAAKESIEETKADIGTEKDNRDFEYA